MTTSGLFREFDLREEFRELPPPGAEEPQGPYAVGQVSATAIPYRDRAAQWRRPFDSQLRGLALGLWCGSECDVALLRVFGNPKGTGPHSALYHLRDRWTSPLLADFYKARWDPTLQAHLFEQKINLPRLIHRLLSFYNMVVVDNVLEQVSQVFRPNPAREVPVKILICRREADPEVLHRSDFPNLLKPVDENAPQLPGANLGGNGLPTRAPMRLTRSALRPSLPTLPPFLRRGASRAPFPAGASRAPFGGGSGEAGASAVGRGVSRSPFGKGATTPGGSRTPFAGV